MTNIAIFASGKGSNAKALIACKHMLKNTAIKKVYTDQENAGVIDIAKENGISFEVFSTKNKTRLEQEKLILEDLKDNKIEWLLLAGYMRILSSDFINTFYDKNIGEARIINIHPSLLPKYRGLHAYEQAFNSDDKESGITVHFVDSGVDTGKVLIQKSFPKEDTDTITTFINKGQKIEHEIYTKQLLKIDQYAGTKNIKDLL